MYNVTHIESHEVVGYLIFTLYMLYYLIQTFLDLNLYTYI